MIQERYKALEVVGLKVAGCRGFKEEYLAELRNIEKKYKIGLNLMESSFWSEIAVLKQTISELRRETGG